MIKVKDLSLSYDGHKKILEDISLTLDRPGMIGIIGPNGAGKSSFLTALIGLVKVQGQVTFGINPKTKAPYQVAYVEQKSQIDFHFPIKVRECLSLGRYAKRGLFRCLTINDWHLIDQSLKQVGLEEKANASIRDLSGGQFQRLLLARCLVQEADIIFLDEPFVGIDAVSEEWIVKLLREQVQKGKLILIVHHDLSKVKTYFDQLIILNKQLIAYGETEQVFVLDHLRKAYGHRFFIDKEDSQC